MIEQKKVYLQQKLRLIGKTDTPKSVDLNRLNRTLDEISEWRTQPHFDDIELLGKDSAEKSKSENVLLRQEIPADTALQYGNMLEPFKAGVLFLPKRSQRRL